jgi:hypothetical protein
VAGLIRLYTQTSGAWRSLVARLLWEQEVAGSNPAAPICWRKTSDPRERIRCRAKI